MCLRFIFCDRSIAKTEAESVDDMVAASNREVVSGKLMLVKLMPDIIQINSPVNKAVSSTPAVDRTTPALIMGLMSAILVSIPPENRMTLRATMPMA